MTVRIGQFDVYPATYFDASDIAAMVGVSCTAIDRLFRDGVVQGWKRDSRWRTSSQALNAFLLHSIHSPKFDIVRKQTDVVVQLV